VGALLLLTNAQQLSDWADLGLARWLAYLAVVAVVAVAAQRPRIEAATSPVAVDPHGPGPA
jgi:hypothetical protein